MSDFYNFLKFIETGNVDSLNETTNKAFLERSIVNDTGRKPLHLACQINSLKSCMYLLKQGCNVEIEDKLGFRPIHVACVAGHFKIVILLLEFHCDIEPVTKEDERPIHLCCKFGYEKIARLLIDKGCSIKKTIAGNYYPIHIACQYGHLDIVKLLIDNKCDITSYTEFGLHPIHIACRYGKFKVFKYFVDSGFEIENQKEWTGAPIHITCQNGHVEILKVLMEKNCDINSITRNNNTALHYAAERGHEEVIKLLLIGGAVVSTTNDSEKTPLQLAKENKHKNCVDLLSDWERNENGIKTIRSSGVKKATEKILFESSENSYIFLGTLLDMCVKLNKQRAVEWILRHFIGDLAKDLNDTLSIPYLFGPQNGSSKPASRILQEFLVYKAIKLKSEDEWDWIASVDIINSNWCTPLNTSYIELAAKFGSRACMRSVMEMLVEVDGTWDNAVQSSLIDNRKNKTVMIIKRLEYLRTRKLAKMNRLHVAVDDDRADVINYILKNNLYDPNSSESHVGTPLSMAYMYGRSECISELDRCTTNNTKTNKFKQSLLHVTLDYGALDSVLITLQSTVYMNLKDVFGCTYLHAAVINNRQDVFKTLLEKYSDVHATVDNLDRYFDSPQDKDHLSNSPPIFPITKIENCFSLCLKLHGKLFAELECKLSDSQIQDFRDGDDNSLLHISAMCILPELCEKLISNGADCNLPNCKGNVPLQEMLCFQNPSTFQLKTDCFCKTVNILASKGTDINIRNHSNCDSFQCSLKYENEQLTENMLCAALNINIVKEDFIFLFENKWVSVIKKIITYVPDNYLDEELLFTCAKWLTLDVFKLIWEKISDQIKSNCVEKLLDLTSNKGLQDIFKYCSEYKITNRKLLENGETIITSLINEGKFDLCNYLLKCDSCGHIIDMPNSKRNTPLHCAAEQYQIDLFENISNRSALLDSENADGETPLSLLLQRIPENETNRQVITVIHLLIMKNVSIIKSNSKNIKPIECCKNDKIKEEIEDLFRIYRQSRK